MTKLTPLNAIHRGLGAKMVDFGGWDMPLHYGSQIEEHHTVRRDCAMFDVSHMQIIDLKGEGVRDFLRYLLANNVDKLKKTGKALYTCMLNEQGGVIDDLIVYFMQPDWFRLVVNAGTADKDLEWIKKQQYTLQAAVEIIPRPDLALIAIQGPNARGKFWTTFADLRESTEALTPFEAAEVGPYFIARTGYTGEDGFEVMLPAEQAESFWKKLSDNRVAAAGLGARDTLRLEAGMNLYGQDMDETVNPLESGLAWTVDLTSPRNFIGKDALISSYITKQLLGLILLDKGVLRGHQRVMTPLGPGEVTSGGFSPTMNQSIALARLPMGLAANDQVQVEVREKLLMAKVVKHPFVRNGKTLV